MDNPIVVLIIWIMQTFMIIGNFVIMLYAFKKFLDKPKNDVISRVTELEVKVKEHDERLLRGNNEFREQDETNKVLISSVLALIEFEIQYCLTEHKQVSSELQAAKDDLHSYLARK